MHPRIGLVLSGGGSRAAYQAGVLRGIAEIAPSTGPVFQILAGTSAGAINVAHLGVHSDNYELATRLLWKLWESIQPEQVYHSNSRAMTLIAARWLRHFMPGRPAGSRFPTGIPVPHHLFRTDPLRRLISQFFDPRRLQEAQRHSALHGIAISTTNYNAGSLVTFFDGDDSIRQWTRNMRFGLRAPIQLEHILASASIPLIFPAVRIDGCFYGDGCVRLTSPLSPAIHLGAERVLAIGIHHRRAQSDTLDYISSQKHLNANTDPSLSDILGVLLDAVFSDSLESDLERMERINSTVSIISRQSPERGTSLRQIPVMAIRPSRDIVPLTMAHGELVPLPFKHLLYALGASPVKGWELLSYLTFDNRYTRQLLELGYQDALRSRKELVEFLGIRS